MPVTSLARLGWYFCVTHLVCAVVCYKKYADHDGQGGHAEHDGIMTQMPMIIF